MTQRNPQSATLDLSPREVKERIRSVFYKHAALDSDNIVVEANGSTVLLKGKIRSWTERKDAEDAAWSMPGVIEVENKLEVVGELYDGE